MRKKRFLAVVLSAAMVAGNTVVASAAITGTNYTGPNGAGTSYNATGSAIAGEASGSVTGTGYLKDKVDMKVFRVVVPTQRDASKEADLFDYILDPQGLIDATQAAKYKKGAAIDGANKNVSVNSYTKSSLYFVNSANGVKSLSDTSDEFQIINKSTMDVDVSVNAKVTAATGISVSTDKAFAGDKSASVYIGYKRTSPTGGKEEIAISENDTAYIDQATIGNAKSFYQVSANADGTMTYDIPSMNSSGKSESENAYKAYKFKLTGATNTKGDWDSLNSGATGPVINITYHLTPHEGGTSYQLTAGKGLAVPLEDATGVEKITFAGDDGEKTLPTDKYSFDSAGKRVIFTNDFCTSMANSTTFTSRDYVIHLTGGGTVQITLTK